MIGQDSETLHQSLYVLLHEAEEPTNETEQYHPKYRGGGIDFTVQNDQQSQRKVAFKNGRIRIATRSHLCCIQPRAERRRYEGWDG